MQFRQFMESENDDYLSSKEFGRGFAKHATKRNIDVDGHLEIDWQNAPVADKTYLVGYKIYDIDNKLVKSGYINYYHLTHDAIYYIVYTLAQQQGIYHPSNLITNDGEFSTAGVAQPKINMNLVKRHWDHIRKYI